VEFKLAKILQLIGTIKRTIFRKVRMENILKTYNTLVLPTLRPLAGYTLYDHKNESVSRELQTECILDKTEEYRRN